MAEVNWICLGKELAKAPNGLAILRALQGHGITHLVKYDTMGVIAQSCSIEMVIDYVHKEK